jgi:hypothetical protein
MSEIITATASRCAPARLEQNEDDYKQIQGSNEVQ